MQLLKQKWYLLLIIIFLLGLSITYFVISTKKDFIQVSNQSNESTISYVDKKTLTKIVNDWGVLKENKHTFQIDNNFITKSGKIPQIEIINTTETQDGIGYGSDLQTIAFTISTRYSDNSIKILINPNLTYLKTIDQLERDKIITVGITNILFLTFKPRYNNNAIQIQNDLKVFSSEIKTSNPIFSISLN